MTRKTSRKRSVTKIFSDSAIINRAVNAGVKTAIDLHRRAGNKVAVVRDGKIVKIDPRKISA